MMNLKSSKNTIGVSIAKRLGRKKHAPLKWRGVFQAYTLCEKWAFAQ